jgi:hypothetical protein
MSYYYSQRQKRIPPPKQQASPHYAGHAAGLHDESRPSYSGNLTQKQTKEHYRPVQRLAPLQGGIDEMGDYADLDGNGDEWPPRTPKSVFRYIPLPFGGNVQYEFHPDQVQTTAHIPQRSSRAALAEGQGVRQAPPPGYEADEQPPTNRPGDRRRTPPWYVLLAAGAVLALTVWIGGAWVNTWWTDTHNDWTYTAQFRTFSIDEVVGHNHDSTAHPSHFIVQNDKRHIIIIELPADDWSKAIIYSAPTLIGDGQEKTPATISFQVNVQTGRLDMVLHVQDQTYIFPNNGQKFVTPQGQ